MVPRNALKIWFSLLVLITVSGRSMITGPPQIPVTEGQTVDDTLQCLFIYVNLSEIISQVVHISTGFWGYSPHFSKSSPWKCFQHTRILDKIYLATWHKIQIGLTSKSRSLSWHLSWEVPWSNWCRSAYCLDIGTKQKVCDMKPSIIVFHCLEIKPRKHSSYKGNAYMFMWQCRKLTKSIYNPKTRHK